MEEKFLELKSEYDEFHRNLLRKGKLPLWDTGRGFFSGAIVSEVFDAFKELKLHRYKSFLDLGSGDGRVVLTAALFGLNSTGIEVDNDLFKKSLEFQERLNIPNAAFFNNDFFHHSIAGFDVVFSNPDEPMSRGLEKKLANELTGKLVVYGHHFHPQNLNKEKSFFVNGTLITVYGKE